MNKGTQRLALLSTGRSRRTAVETAPACRRQPARPAGEGLYRLSGIICLLFAFLLGGIISARADTPATLAKPSMAVAQTAQPAPTPGAPLPTGAPPGATLSQPITVQAGTGVLLRLPQPAATVMSAEPGVARVQPASPTSLFLMGVAPGRTTVIATTDAGQAIVQYDVTVAPGRRRRRPAAAAVAPGTISPAIAMAIQATIARTVQGASGVRVQGAGTDAILTGTVPNAVAAQQAEAIARGYVGDKGWRDRQPDRAGQPSRSTSGCASPRSTARSRGSSASTGRHWAPAAPGASACGPAPRHSVPAITPLLPLGLATTLQRSHLPISLAPACTSGNWDVNGIIDALAADQLITVLAEPNLTALSGETASFLAGGEFPIPIAGEYDQRRDHDHRRVQDVRRQPGAVVPTVLSSTRLNLRVRPEVSQLSTNGAVSVPVAGGSLTIPALTVRRAETTVELGSGQSFAIAGLLQKTSLDATNALPWIGEIPVLGALFKSNDFQRGESELVIIVTPYVVQPASSPTAAADADGRLQAGDRPGPDPVRPAAGAAARQAARRSMPASS